MEQRKNTRLDLKIETDIIGPKKKVIKCITQNVSIGGASLFGENVTGLKPGKTYSIVLNIKKQGDLYQIKLDVLIVRLEEYQVGVKFLSCDKYDYKLFKYLLFSKAPSFDDFMKELAVSPGPKIIH